MMSRRLILLLILMGAGVALALAVRAERTPAADVSRLSWVVTAHQFGPVGYRDPAGALSPDGRWIAYSEGRFLRVRPVDGGPSVGFPPGAAQIRNIAWSPDDRTILADGNETQTGWAAYDRVAGTRRELWASDDRMSELRQLAWSADGQSIAAVVNGEELRILSAAGSVSRTQNLAHRIAFPAWTPGGTVACVETIDGRSRVTIPCGGAAVRTDPDLDVYGPIAFAPDGRTMYVAFANGAGTVDLWAAPTAGGRARRLTSFARDSYAPSVAADGTVLFRVQSYRTVVAIAPAEGGLSRALATFQSETPSWAPDGLRLGITYGTWRRVIDDAHYPDIAQDAGIVGVNPDQPAAAPSGVVHASVSEDQALCWSPNGRWIAFHSHKDQSDDIWLRPAAGETAPERISFLGRGAEVGWPRWAPDGKWILFDGNNRTSHRSVMWVVGVDQETGTVTSQPSAITVSGVDAEVSHAEWLPDSAHVAVLGKEAPGRHVIYTVSRDGGEARIVHRLASEHDAPGLAVSPDGRDVAFIAPSADGFFQVFRLPLAGGTPVAVTTDPSHKTQPAWSPDGRRIAFTVWDYESQFWRRQ
jgi:Tol biopolymer transport system component